MTTKKIYGPWIKWYGDECPVPPDTVVMVQMRSGKVLGPNCASAYLWNHADRAVDIVKYCVVLEQADLDVAEKLLRENGYTVTPPAKPLTFEDVVPMTEAPKKGTWYWVVHPFNENGVDSLCWDDDEFDKPALRLRAAYLDEAHARIAAKHIFGLKGGEL